MTNEHTSLEKYTSHTLFTKGLRKGCKRVVCERWVEDGTDCNILTPSSSDYSSTSFSFCWAAQPGVLRAQAIRWELVLTASNCNSNSNCNWPQLTETVCGTWLYNCLPSTCFPWASHAHRIQPVHRSRWHLRHPRPDAPVSWLTAQSKVNMLHIHVYIYKYKRKQSTIMTNFYEQTNTLLYKNIISHTLFSKAGCWLCVRDELETRTGCYFDLKFSDHSSTSSSSWLGWSTVGHWGPKVLCLPLALISASCPQLAPIGSNSFGHLVI